ncbi:MAG: AEC family transporter, partial [Oscillospiraceae bacterium]|nr:AEC family transporter [Oscillospiraceae bacterium]
MGDVASAFSGVLTLLLLIGAGILAVKLGYISEETETKLSKFTLHFSVPCLLFLNCLTYISRELISEYGLILLVPFLIMLIGYGLSLAVGKLAKIPRENFGLFCVMFSLSNTIFIGLPVCTAIFGDQALPLVAAYFPFNTLMFWTLGAMGLAKDGGAKFKPGLGTVKTVLSPPLIGALLGAAFALLEIGELPGFITEGIRYMGNLTTPVACILAGCT